MTRALLLGACASTALLLGAPPLTALDDGFAAAMQASAEQRYGAAAAGFHNLARQGDATAAYNLAVLFATGRGVPRNDAEALYWAWQAWLAGVKAAPGLVAQLRDKVDRARQIAIAQRLEDGLSARAMGRDDGPAMLQLAAVLGRVRPRPDPVAAYAWQSLAAALDVPGAIAERDRTHQALSAPARVAAQDAAFALFAKWCVQWDLTDAPAACALAPQRPEQIADGT